MRVLLASGIFFPDVGGPATHVRKIAEHLSGVGWRVTVVAFGDVPPKEVEGYNVRRVSRRYGKLLSWFFYGLVIFREAMRHDIVYAFDLTTAGIPSALATKVLRKPFYLRIGGDPIWERAVEHGRRFLPMRAYYGQSLYKEDRPLLSKMIRFVIGSAQTVVTYCDFLKDIYAEYYGARNILIIKNPLPERSPAISEKKTFTFLFAGRFVSYKNLSRVLRVFARITKEHAGARIVLIGDGPDRDLLLKEAAGCGDAVRVLPKVDQAELFEYIDTSSVALGPALTEFNPNFILESLSRGKPALISRDNGLSVTLPAHLQFDPMEDESLYAAMRGILDPARYKETREFVSRIPMDHTWQEVVASHEALLRQARTS